MSGFDPRAGIQPGEENDPSELPVFEQEIDLNAEQLSEPGAIVPVLIVNVTSVPLPADGVTDDGENVIVPTPAGRGVSIGE